MIGNGSKKLIHYCYLIPKREFLIESHKIHLRILILKKYLGVLN